MRGYARQRNIMKIKFEKLPATFGAGDGIYCRGEVAVADAVKAASKRGGRYASTTEADVVYGYARVVSSARKMVGATKGVGAFPITIVRPGPRKSSVAVGSSTSGVAGTASLVPKKHHMPNPYRVCGRVAFIGLTDIDGKIVAEAKVDTSFVKPALFSRRWRATYDMKTGKVTGVNGCHYAKDRNRKSNERLGRVVMNAPKGTRVVHINGNGLDCRRANLRVEKIGVS